MSKSKTNASSSKKANARKAVEQASSGIVRPAAKKLPGAKRQALSIRKPKASAVGPDRSEQLARLFTGMLGGVATLVSASQIVDFEAAAATVGLDKETTTLSMQNAFAEFVNGMAPRDPLEKLTLEQLLLHHMRVLALSQQAAAQSSANMIKILNEAVGQASGSYRRLMAAFGEYRKKPSQQPIVAIAQTNVAHQQQIVQCVDEEQKKAANELGCKTAKTLPCPEHTH